MNKPDELDVEPVDSSDETLHPYAKLTPDRVLDAVEGLGYISDARVFGLNSYENRVYQVGIEAESPLIAKFYRPGRWTDQQILEEHDFSLQLAELELPVVPPIIKDQQSLFYFDGFRFALFKRRGGHAPELENPDHLETLGRTLGRIHALGQQRPFEYRPSLDVTSFAAESRDYLLDKGFIPHELEPAYRTLAKQLIELCEQRFAEVAPRWIRVHGDCHVGNILWREELPSFVDFDDCRNAPAIQDLWMFLSGRPEEQAQQMRILLEGYQAFCDFNYAELNLIEPLRTLRLMHYAAWLARRWQDPAFPSNFTWFNSQRYWYQHLNELKEQLAAIQEPCLQLFA